MHPNPLFRSGDDESWLAFAHATGFAHILVPSVDGPMVIHAPVVRSGERTLAFHVARANRARVHLDGARVVASIAAVDGYVSPNWYAGPGSQVPTWNYVAAEFEGVVCAIDTDALVASLDALAAAHEPRVNPANPWTRAKMDDAVFRKMLGGIEGFEIAVDAVRVTGKLGRHKSDADQVGVVAGLIAAGNVALADAVR